MIEVDSEGVGKNAIFNSVHYLEEKGVRSTLNALTKALLSEKPDNPQSFMVSFLQQDGNEAPPPHTESSTGFSMGAAMRSASSYLQSSTSTQHEGILRLLDSAAEQFGGAMSFYSSSGSRGRAVNVASRSPSTAEDASFRLVATSTSAHGRSDAEEMQPGARATGARSEVLAAALQKQVAAKDGFVAATVRSPLLGGLEGLLLAEVQSPAGSEQLNGDYAVGTSVEGYQTMSYQALRLLPAMELWSSVLAERLACSLWKDRAQAAESASLHLKQNLSCLVTHRRLASRSIPHGVVGESACNPDAVVKLWNFLPDLDQFVIEKHVLPGVTAHKTASSSRFSQVFGPKASRMPSKKTLLIPNRGTDEPKWESEGVGLAAMQPEGDDMAQICIPVELPSQQGRVDLAIVAFEVKAHEASERLHWHHFDRICAEITPQGVLKDFIQGRQCLLDIATHMKAADDMKQVIDSLNGCKKVADVVLAVEDICAASMHCERATMFFIDDDRNCAWAPPSAKLPRGIMFPLDEQSLVGHVVKVGRDDPYPSHDIGFMLINSPAECPYWAGDVDQNFKTRNMVVAPIWSQGPDGNTIIGVVEFLNKHVPVLERKQSQLIPARFDESDMPMLKSILAELSVSIKRLMLDMVWSRALMDDAAEDSSTDKSRSVEVQQAAGKMMLAEYYGDGKNTMNTLSVLNEVQHMTAEKSATQTASGALKTRGTVFALPSCVIRQDEIPAWASVDNWAVDYFLLSEKHQYMMLHDALDRCNLLANGNDDKLVSVQPFVLNNFFMKVKQAYRDVPYHNAQHAISTVHLCYQLMKGMAAQNLLTDVDRFAVLLGAICHDIDHRGHNSAFEITSSSELALRYNDSSPLENHHCARAFEIALQKSGGAAEATDIFRDMESSTYAVVRQRMIIAILATDMKHHGAHVELVAQYQPKPKGDESQSILLVESIVHAADIGNPYMVPEMSQKWGGLLAEEFACQADDERELGMPVTVFMDGLRDRRKAAKSSAGFMDFVAMPLMNPLFKSFPGLVEGKHNFETNRVAIQAILDEDSLPGKANTTS
eukprot:TRINITY_DN2445_c0_g2_i1.p1 TRINITY_DN2445_c0_g2~~TRINITY_DN2445_c0_g2_i1.p1  ORF type:complete len:1056 (-),score=233.76 TRINITY_DN2445_c0_g2_i1:72-3239(-)